MLKFSIGFFVAITSFLYLSNDAVAATELTYACEVIVAASDVTTSGGIFKFTAKEVSGSHGGEPRLFTEGVHQVQIIADAQWLGLSWSKSGVKIAEALFVMAPLDRTLARVGIVYDPTDNGDQVSVNCAESALGQVLPSIAPKLSPFLN